MFWVHFNVGSKKLKHGCRMICAGCPSLFGLGLEDGHVAIFCLLVYFGGLEMKIPFLGVDIRPLDFLKLSSDSEEFKYLGPY